MGDSSVSWEHPFAARPEERDPARRFRGRLVAPVTVWTAGGGDGVRRAGLTVSSVAVAEGEPPSVVGLVGPLTDLWEVVGTAKRFVVHVVGEDQRRLADVFAGRFPGPGDPFDGADVEPTDWGPVLTRAPTRAYCTLGGFLEAGHSLLVVGTVDRFDLPDRTRAPLAHYRGAYAGLRDIRR